MIGRGGAASGQRFTPEPRFAVKAKVCPNIKNMVRLKKSGLGTESTPKAGSQERLLLRGSTRNPK